MMQGQERMAIGILYESDEWSDHKLASELARAVEPANVEVVMIDMERDDCIERALACTVVISRVFASAAFRGHEASFAHMDELMAALADTDADTDIVLLNPPCAHRYEIDKVAAAAALAQAGIVVPRLYAQGTPAVLADVRMPFPCIIKPLCGGRTTCTALVQDAQQTTAFLKTAPDVVFLVQEYIEPVRGFITRIEIVDGAVVLAVKRSIAENGLSAYRFGSTYEAYKDLPDALRRDAERAAHALGFVFGSFDVIEGPDGPVFIDANSVSNVSEDCTELFGMDLMQRYARAITARVEQGKI